ncbi:probable cytochrome P450 4d20 isoform X2 [Temnothorax curvispinosus]|uniref:Probable cytochrome P450 4d20 isoform X2 n=1 Tax=Temnothorax curvispinosus TaxID=300111 RepID=A0A6J1QRF4_9HYME|nr:probable cytochrome P450 4d20 isoform X2 [Temnothorax curvispinosus]
MIQQRIRKLNNPDILENENNQIYRTCFDILMEAFPKENFTSKQIRDIVITMLLTASESISIAMNFVIFMLANFPKVQEKVLEELLEIYGTETIKSVPIKYDDLQKMHYLDRVIKETMRIFPVIPIIGRQAKEDLKIGMKYAMMSMKVILATLARTFVFKVNKSVKIDEIKLKFSLTISTEKPLKVKLEKRYFQ